MRTNNLFRSLTLVTLISLSIPASAAKDQTTAFSRMQDFHLQQAEAKIAAQQLAHAWGDLAYLVCRVPNHHIALKYMLILAPRLNKTTELQQYFAKAIAQFPDDQELISLYNQLGPTQNCQSAAETSEESAVYK